MHGGALAHFSPAVRGVLSNTYQGRLIDRGGPTAWPPSFTLDLNRLDFYRAVPNDPCVCNEETLHYCTVDSFGTNSNYPHTFERMRRSMMRHVEA
jgi:hypothetical protein